jgi:hypothetical protein
MHSGAVPCQGLQLLLSIVNGLHLSVISNLQRVDFLSMFQVIEILYYLLDCFDHFNVIQQEESLPLLNCNLFTVKPFH